MSIAITYFINSLSVEINTFEFCQRDARRRAAKTAEIVYLQFICALSNSGKYLPQSLYFQPFWCNQPEPLLEASKETTLTREIWNILLSGNAFTNEDLHKTH